MSDFTVKSVLVDEVSAHPNADRLDVVHIAGWNCVASKDLYKKGDVVVYIPIDSILPTWLEARLFPADSKIKLNNSRVRSIKIRGIVSQGMLLSPKLIEDEVAKTPLGEDISAKLGIKKHEPPLPAYQQQTSVAPKKNSNPHFKEYVDINNFKNFPFVFKEGEAVYISEKLHGTSARYAIVPKIDASFGSKVRAFFQKLLGTYNPNEFIYGSRRRQLHPKSSTYYEENVYAKIADQLQLEELLKPGEALYGEIVGMGIQKGYSYGCKEGEHKFFAYDVRIDGKWLSCEEFTAWCSAKGIPQVPMLYIGAYSEKLTKELVKGDSTIGGQKVREGVVVKSLTEETCAIGRKLLKYISDEYLLKDQTDFH